MGATIGSRDLSLDFTGVLKVSVEGVGTLSTAYTHLSLAGRVAQVVSIYTGENLPEIHPGHTPWEIVIFDPAARELVVKPALD